MASFFVKFLVLVTIAIQALWLHAQPVEGFDIERPKKFEDKKIGFENTFKKRFALPRRFFQNTTSHYNYFYNANEKVKSIIEKATLTQKDSFDKLLPYYTYNLASTKTQTTDIDSVMQKATAGILTHDLRSNWVDNFYLLIGKAYLLKQAYDSAAMTFNYINYAYGPRTKDKDRELTGTKVSNPSGATAFSIATNEKVKITKKLLERPPSRNEAFVLLVRTYIEAEDYGSAAGLIQTLQNDPFFPKRLHNDLDELTGYMYYKQLIYDSAAHYVVKAFTISENKNDKARRQFLAAQLYALAGNNVQATLYYAKSVQNTLDPVMDVYARLYAIRLNKATDTKIIDNNLAALLKMARKDAYTEYRDIIYYFAAQMELERNEPITAKQYLLKSASLAGNNITQKNKTYLTLATLAYNNKQYISASNYYDSLQLSDPSLTNLEDLQSRKELLKLLVNYEDIIHTEDSLQTVAKLPLTERVEYLKKILKQLRKAQGLSDDPNFGSASAFNNNNNSSTAVDIFAVNNGEWYFNNNSLKSRGYTEFKRQWGNRPNVDGWRLAASISNSASNAKRNSAMQPQLAQANSKKTVKELTLDALAANLPLTDSLLRASNDTIASTLYLAGALYQFQLNNTTEAINTYLTITSKYSNHKVIAKTYHNLYLAYSKLGDSANAQKIRKVLADKYPAQLPQATTSATLNASATAAYNQVYDVFLQGKFSEAKTLKMQADSLYGNNKWSQQLGYIESVYYIKNRQDSLANISLTQTININATTPVAAKALKLQDVLSRRSTIEAELTNLQVTRQTDTLIPNAIVTKPTVIQPAITPTKGPTATTTKVKDSVKATPKLIPTGAPKFIYKKDTLSEQYVAIVLYKVDNTFTTEARNAFIIYNRSQPRSHAIDVVNLDIDTKLLLMDNFTTPADAYSYIQTTRAKATTDIVPWLKPDKYSFIQLTQENLKLLQVSKNVANYTEFLQYSYPNMQW